MELLEAFILWWNTTSFAVLCPVCGHVEVHRPKSNQKTLEALCKIHHFSYRATFHEIALCEGGTICYEINRVKSRLETVGLNVPEMDNLERVQGSRLEMGDLAFIDESFEERHHFMTIDEPLSEADGQEEASMRQMGAVKNFLALRPLGETAENADQQGEVMQFLTRDLFSGLKIGSEMPIYHHKLTRTNRNMRRIDAVINTSHYYPHLKPTVDLGELHLLESQRPSPSCLQVLAPYGTKDGVPFTVPLAILKRRQVNSRTVAVLCRGNPYPPVIAESGWSRSISDSEFVIDNGKWSKEVERLANYVGHTLEPYHLDFSHTGMYCASHAEKQVIAYFVSKHCFFDDGFEYPDINKLKSITPGQGLLKARIAVDQKPCKDCIMFRKKVESLFHIKFHFVKMDCDFHGKVQKKSMASEKTMGDVRGSQSQWTGARTYHFRDEQDEHENGIADNEANSDSDDDYHDSDSDSDSDALGDPESPTYGRNVTSSFRKDIYNAVRHNVSSVESRRKQRPIPRIMVQEMDLEIKKRRTRSSAVETLLGTPKMTEFGFDPILSPKKLHKRARIEDDTEVEYEYPQTRRMLAKKSRGLVTPTLDLDDPFLSPSRSTPTMTPVLTPTSLRKGIDNLVHNTEKLNLRKRHTARIIPESSEDEEADEMVVDRLTRSGARGRNMRKDVPWRGKKLVIDLTVDSDNLHDYHRDEAYVNDVDGRHSGYDGLSEVGNDDEIDWKWLGDR